MHGLSDGGITLSGSGGTPPYTYDFGAGFVIVVPLIPYPLVTTQ